MSGYVFILYKIHLCFKLPRIIILFSFLCQLVVVFVEKVLKRLFPRVPCGQEKSAPVTPASDKPARRVAAEEVPTLAGEGLGGWGFTVRRPATLLSAPEQEALSWLLGVLGSRVPVPRHSSPLCSGGEKPGPGPLSETSSGLRWVLEFTRKPFSVPGDSR